MLMFIYILDVAWLVALASSGALVFLDVLASMDENRCHKKASMRMKCAAFLFIAALSFKAMKWLMLLF